jgi:hypothetical protein
VFVAEYSFGVDVLELDLRISRGAR